MIDYQREDFEKWIKRARHTYSLDKKLNYEAVYRDNRTGDLWQAWCAAIDAKADKDKHENKQSPL